MIHIYIIFLPLYIFEEIFFDLVFKCVDIVGRLNYALRFNLSNENKHSIIFKYTVFGPLKKEIKARIL